MTAITGQPAYRQVANDLRSKVADGTYAVGAPIPSTTQLMEIYKGSITVVRAAIRELQGEGILIGQPGKGVYVQRLPTGAEIGRNTDPHTRIAVLEAAVAALTTRLETEVAGDVQQLRQQVGVLEGLIMDLYGRSGISYPHSPGKERQPSGSSKRAGSAS